MAQHGKGCSRRQFLKVAGATGMGSLLGTSAEARQTPVRTLAQQTITSTVPKRPFGRSGIDVSILSMGGMFDIAANQLMLKQALRWGVTYWDTADCYQHGSETGIGKYFKKNPQDRQKVFLVSKSDDRDPGGIGQLLDRSLERMNTSYVDLYFIHGIRSIKELDDDTRRWAEKAKADKKIRLFGFSTHSNMAACLQAAAKRDWIDGIMMTYNFRNMFTEEMKTAMAACEQAGIGLTAMKVQAGSSWFNFSKPDPAGAELNERLLKKGFTEGQAKLKVVWNNPQIASICSQMDSMRLLKENVAAAADPTGLSSREVHLFKQQAVASADQYCTGCGQICEAAVGGQVPVSDIMRYHMYCQSYGKSDWARAHFEALPSETRKQMASVDYTEAERQCPQRMPIGRLMRQALDDFG